MENNKVRSRKRRSGYEEKQNFNNHDHSDHSYYRH